MNKYLIWDLQLFDDAGTVVNATGNYVNAYTGATEAFTPASTLAPEMKDYYDTTLLENYRVKKIYAQFGKHVELSARHSGRVEFRKFNTFARATQLVEGVIPAGQKVGVSTIYGSIAQYGTYVTVSDKLELRGYDDIIDNATLEMSASMNESQEVLTRDALLTGTNVIYCPNILLATRAIDGAVPTSCAQMKASSTSVSLLTPDVVAQVVTHLRRNKAPTIGNSYVAVIHPSVAHDLRNCPEWVDLHRYDSSREIFNGEIGELHGVRFVMNPDAPVLGVAGETSAGDDEYVNAQRTHTYATYFFGLDPFGIIDPEGGGAEMIVHDKSEIGGPLNQFSTIGYKFETNGATILYPERMVRVMSCSKYSDVDVVN